MKIYALANELNLDRSNAGTITVPFGTWDYGQKKLPDGRNLFFRQTLDLQGAGAIAAQIADSIAKGEKGVPVYWGHPDVTELAHKYPDKRAKGWITSASVEDGKLVLSVDWLEDKATDGFGWFSPFWTGPVKENGDGTALMHVDSLTSVALINMPNIQEFRLANELQDTNNAAQAYGNRWQVERSFETVKQEFSLEKLRVRTFRRLKNVFSPCVVAYLFVTRYLRASSRFKGIVKAIRDNCTEQSLRTHPLLANLRSLIGEERIRNITGRPRKPPEKEPDQLEFAFPDAA